MSPQTINAFIKAARKFLDVLESETERKTPDPEPPTTSKTIEQTPANDEAETESKPRRRSRKARTTNKPKISEPETTEEIDAKSSEFRNKLRTIGQHSGKDIFKKMLSEYGVERFSDLSQEDLKVVNQTVDKLLADIEANEAA